MTLQGILENFKPICITSSTEHTIELCSEEIMEEILNRFYKYNQHANSYTWKYNGECGPGVWALVGARGGALEEVWEQCFNLDWGGSLTDFTSTTSMLTQHANTIVSIPLKLPNY